MKPSAFLLLAFALSVGLWSPRPVSAQDTSARAVAERDAAEERAKMLNSTLESLMAAKTQQDQRINELSEEIKRLQRTSRESGTDTARYASREEVQKLAEKLQEIDAKRIADHKLIVEQFEELRKDLKKWLTASPADPAGGKPKATPKKPKDTPEPSPGAEKPAPGGSQEGTWHTVGNGETLSTISAAYNEEFKKAGKKTSVTRILEANPGLKATSLKVGAKVWIPMVGA